jgi:hypothetical protein|uniref:tetratricopeptide repeat protein n=1 Tax=Alloprevotella sp. TaxID=1872471 RepID=UPI004027B58B
MGIISSLFGTGKPNPDSQYVTLRDDGIRAMQMGELAYAEKCFKAALDIKHELHTVSLLAEAYLRTGNNEEALPLLQEISASPQDTLEVDLLLAQTQGRLHSYADERTTTTTILSAHPEEARALYLAAEADHGLGEDFMAIAHLTQCLTLRHDYEEALLLRAQILVGMGQWNEVLADAESLVELNAESETYHTLRADAYAALGRTDEAITEYEAVRELNPFTDSVMKLGALYEHTTRWDKALSLYNEVIDLRPNYAPAYKARGGVKHHLKDEVGAAEDLKRSLEIAPEMANDLEGQYSNVENKMNDYYKQLNPYHF